MAKFTLVDGDMGVLTKVYNSLREGSGTALDLGVTVEGFLDGWRKSPSAFASPSGFVGISGTSLVVAQYESGPVDALFAEDCKALLPEILKAWDLQVIRAATIGEKPDRILTMAGLKLDGTLRKLSADASGMLQDVSMWSLTKEDLLEKPEAEKRKVRAV